MYLDDERAENIARNVWIKKYESFNKDRATYDGWMDDFKRSIDKCITPIIDLGCGNSNNALHLARMGKQVQEFEFIYKREEIMKDRYEKPKVLWRCVVCNRK